MSASQCKALRGLPNTEDFNYSGLYLGCPFEGTSSQRVKQFGQGSDWPLLVEQAAGQTPNDGITLWTYII